MGIFKLINKKNQKGFTLVELMIVIVIIGILVAVAVPIYKSVQKNARKKACLSNIKVLQSAVLIYQVENGTENVDGIFSGERIEFNPANLTNINASYLKAVQNPEIIYPNSVHSYTLVKSNKDEHGNYHSITVYCSRHGNLDGQMLSSHGG